MSKKGFTLIELLAVIIILGLIALVSISTVLTSIKQGKEKLFNSQLKLIESSAISYVSNRMNKTGNNINKLVLGTLNEEYVIVKLEDLQEDGDVEYNVSNPLCNSSDKFFDPKTTVIKVTYTNDFSYEITYLENNIPLESKDGRDRLTKSCTAKVVK